MEQQGMDVGIPKSATIAAHSIATAPREFREIDSVIVVRPATYFAVLYLYKESGDKPLHALGAEPAGTTAYLPLDQFTVLG
ncbi:hypothetical protein [Nostoc sp.]